MGIKKNNIMNSDGKCCKQLGRWFDVPHHRTGKYMVGISGNLYCEEEGLWFEHQSISFDNKKFRQRSN